MPIKIAKRCVVDRPAVEKAIVMAAQGAARRWADYQRGLYADYRRSWVAQNKAWLERISALSKSDRRLLDAEVGLLFQLPYERVGIHERGEITYLYGQTRPIKMKATGHRRHPRRGIWDMGRYLVFLNLGVFGGGSLNHNGLHMIPERDPKARCRHPHHTARGDSNPLDMSASTCTAGYGPVFTTSRDECLVGEFLRQIYMFITRCNLNSPLCSDWQAMGIKVK